MSQERRLRKQHAAAIKQLGGCCSGPLSASKGAWAGQPQKEPTWDFTPVRLAPGRRRLAGQPACHTGARLGQAVLQLPLAGSDVALQLPPALQLAATAAGNLDCRLQLFGMTADWPAQRQPTHAGDGSDQPRLLPAKSAAAGFACRSGALLLAHALFPDHTRGLLGWLAVPVAVADGLEVLHSAVPPPARAAVAVRASRLKGRLQGRRSSSSSSSSSSSGGEEGWDSGVGWVDGTGGVVQGSLHALRCLSGPVAALASAGWLWSMLHPSSHSLASCLVALAAVAADYGALSKDISRGRVQPGQELEAAWHLLLLLTRIAALLDLLLVLLLGGHWAAGIGAWESAGLFLRRRAWRLLLFSSSAAGAAFIKWGQWSSARRDIFPEDFCDTLAALHDNAPVHSFRHTRRAVEAAFGKPLRELFESFDPKPLASGSIAQVHRATLRRHAPTAANPAAQQAAAADEDELTQVVVKVCHPNVHRHICLDFRLLAGLSAAAARVPALRGLSLRESVAQFSHTMTAQTDLRVEGVHALRFSNNFSGVASSVQIPRPIPGLISQQVLVETYEPGQSVAQYMKRHTPINAHIVGLGVDAFLKMLLVDNFVHTDLHPGNILFRAVPHKHAAQQQRWARQQRQQQQDAAQAQQQVQQGAGRRRRWQFWRSRSSRGAAAADGEQGAGAAAAAAAPEQWELELQQMIGQQQRRWASKQAQPGADGSSVANARLAAAAAAAAANPVVDEAAQLLEQQLAGGSSSSSSNGQPALEAQLVLLDFGLAEQLTAEVRHHFISFLNAISAGDGLCAARHLLRWSHTQACEDPRGFTSDVMDLFSDRCRIGSEAGIDLDGVMKAVLGLARKWGVSIDSCYASLVISVCVLVGFAQALDPGVNIMDAATPALLAYSLTGKVVGRLYS
ncbi:hypothetical protein OEZ86_002957 [Tetradesmus obliquus]|nr:hypothetical protein OEZ86_002957 [Tetradesmus obliquus]